MSTIEKNESALFSRHHRNYCCQQKQYYLNHQPTLVNTLKILPRVIIYKKSLKLGNIYETLVSVTNHGLHNRHLMYTTDSEDISISIHPKCVLDNFLAADQAAQITVCLEPKSKLNINRRRHIFIQAEHPNITFTLPIIILSKNHDIPSLPDMVVFPSTCTKTFTFYEMILYNDDTNKLPFTIKCNCSHLTMMVPVLSIAKHNYIKILLKLSCNDMKEVRNVIRLKFGLDSYEIPFVHQPIEWTLFPDTLHMQFDPIKFNGTATKSFRICNESKHNIRFHVHFTTEEENETCYATCNASAEKDLYAADSRRTSSCISKHSTSSTELSQIEFVDRTHKEIERLDKFSSRHFQFEPQCGTISSNSSFLIHVTFKPIMNKDFGVQDQPPFPVLTTLFVSAQDELKSERKVVIVKGYINGPDVEIIPKLIDFRTVYFGEEHCAEIKVINIDGLTDCHVYFHDFVCHDDANAVVTPKEGFDLKPCQSGVFHLQFFAKTVGKIFVKLQFKVRNGSLFSIMVRGSSQPVRVKCFPDVLELGTVPVCVPQVRLVLLMNPLHIPITVQCSVQEDGIETPLVLNVANTNEHLPIHIKNPVYHLTQCHQEEEQNDENVDTLENEEEKPRATINESTESEDVEQSLMSYQSMILDDDSSYSTEFQEQALEHIPEMASSLLSYLKKIKIFDKPEMEKTVVEEALNTLLKTPYFHDMDKYKNYCNMDWNGLSSDPKEIYCNNEVIYLNSNTGKAISVVVIPNVIGRQHKYMELRVCPIIPPPPTENDPEPNHKEIVDSDYLLSKLWIEYNCSVPEIMWDSVIDMQEPLYVGELYEFEMIFENCSKIGGFFYYDAIPDNEFGTMRFLNDRWKYFVQPESIERVPCAIEFKKTGFVTLLGLIKFVGVNAGFPYHIKSEILPPGVNVEPRHIVKKLQVLEPVNIYIYIDNATPTTTWLSLKLKDNSHVSIYPNGAQLAPTGQGMYATLNVSFKDPGTYKNTLKIIMQYETIQKIPITLHVEGMPIFFEPEIRTEGLQIGCILCTTEDEYLDENKPNYCKVIRVINKGERQYRIVLTKTKCSEKTTCAITPSRAKVNVKPNYLVLEPMSVDYIIIFSNACEECSIYNEFRIDIMDLSEPIRKQSSMFVVTGQFIFPQLLWNRPKISMDYYRTHKYKENPQCEILKLTNAVDNFMELVILKLTGPFLLKTNFEDPFVKELEFSMLALETKEVTVMLDKKAIRNRLDTYYEGRITCVANSRVQKSVCLKVNMFIPTLDIQQNDVILFTKNTEGGTYIQLHNTGRVQAIYKWKKLQEDWQYISEEDNFRQFVDIILSDIIHMLDLNCIDFENDSETNMTKRYQKFRCHLHEIADPVNIKSLIYEIIDDLDLKNKRYKFQWPEPQTEPSEDAKRVNETTEELIMSNIYVRSEVLENQMDEALAKLDQEQHNEQFYGMEFQLTSKTIYFNRKFKEDPSSTENQSCVFHTLDYVLDNLKLEDSYTISQPSSETCEPNRSVYFFEKTGIVEENQWEMCALHIPAIRRGYEVCASFQLDVVGGKTQEFHITLVNLDTTIKLSKDNVYLGLKPWYEQFKTTITAENITKYHITLSIRLVPKPSDKLPKLATGYVKILNEKLLTLPTLETTSLKAEGIMGFCEEFIREIKITINGSDEMKIRLRGHGILPMLAVAKRNLPFVEEQDMLEIMDEYGLLQKIYYFEIFKTITECDEEMPGPNTEENELIKSLSLVMDIELSSSSSPSETKSTTESTESHKHDKGFNSLLQTYVWVNNNDELPNSTILEQLVATEKFLSNLRLNAETCSLLSMLYEEYLRLRHSYDQKIPINLKHFTIQPMPFHLKGQVLDMGEIRLNQYRKFVVNLEFFGPGKLIAAIRTVIKIPGLIVSFGIENTTGDKDFIYYQAENKSHAFPEKLYRNMSERLLDAERDPKVKHAHSYDVNIRSQHQRDVTAKERKWVLSYYNSLKKSVYLEQKHHFTYCKIFSNCKYNFSGTKINIVVLIRPEKRYFKPGQKIEDYLFVDVSDKIQEGSMEIVKELKAILKCSNQFLHLFAALYWL